MRTASTTGRCEFYSLLDPGSPLLISISIDASARVRKVKRSLASLRKAGDVRGVIGVLDVCLRPSFAGVERVRLYSETFYGTKDLVESESAFVFVQHDRRRLASH